MDNETVIHWIAIVVLHAFLFFTKFNDRCHSLYIHSYHTLQHADRQRKTGQQAEVNIMASGKWKSTCIK